MARKIVFTNGKAETLTIETNPYIIIKLEGLGIPNVDRQEQKAPYQDGTTYIDSLFNNREIVIELAIAVPNDFNKISIYRRQLSQRLCPKYGLGTITYTDEAGNSYAIRAVVSSLVFPNKDYRDPYAHAMVTFTANDPYWKSVLDTTISLPTSITSAQSVINAAGSNYPSIIERADGSLFVVYVRVADSYLVSRTYTTSWSAESVINSAGSSYPSVIERSDKSLFVVYARLVDNYLVSRTYTTSWSAESVINSATSIYPSVIERSDKSLFVVYARLGDYYLVSRTYTTSWSAESVINSAGSIYSSVIERADGSLFVAYVRFADNYLVSRTYTTSWSAESVINSANSANPSVIERSDKSLFIVYTRVLDNYLVSRTYTTSWSAEGVISVASGLNPSVTDRSDGSLFVVARRAADCYLISVIRSVTPVTAVNSGDVSAPFLITFQGPSTNPRIINKSTLEYIKLNTTLATSDHFDVDTSFGNKTVTLTQGGIVKNGIAFLDIGSTFFQLERGSNVVYFEDDAVASPATATMKWTERYVGV